LLSVATHASEDSLDATRARWSDVGDQIARNHAVVHRVTFNAEGRSWPAVGTYGGEQRHWFGFEEEARALTPHPLKVEETRTVAARVYRADYLYSEAGKVLFAWVRDPEKPELRIYWNEDGAYRVQVGETVQPRLTPALRALADAVRRRGAALADQARQVRAHASTWTDFSAHDW
jgi:hypothetical protein